MLILQVFEGLKHLDKMKAFTQQQVEVPQHLLSFLSFH